MTSSRRAFLRGSAALYASATFAPGAFASLLQGSSSKGDSAQSRTLTAGWEYYQGPLDPWQVWHSEELVTWEKQTLPHCFNHYDACDPDTPAYRGSGWYRTQLNVVNPFTNGRTLLLFEGAGQSAEVYVGTTRVGEHVGGYDEFVVDVTDAVKANAGKDGVPLSVHCSNGRDLERMPSDLSDFTLYGGLYRPLHLVYVPAVSVEAVHTMVTWKPSDAQAMVQVTGRLYGASTPDVELHVKITAPDGSAVAEKTVKRGGWKGDGAISSFAIAAPQLWSPQTPRLYRCDVTVGEGAEAVTVSHRFGVRHTRFEEHGPFFLNGERLLLRGTQRHEDHAGYAAAVPEDLVRREFALMKAMGVNFVRLGHYQQSRLVLDLCDELGILVWEEVPWCRSGVGSALFRERGRVMMRTMIDQHRNHPSVLLWGLGNEDDWPGELNGKDQAAIRAYMTELREIAHTADPSRLTSYRRADFVKDIPDVYSPSIWAGWYSGRYTEYAAALAKARNATPHFMHVEWGADSHAGRHAEDPDPALGTVVTGKGTAEVGFDYKLSGGSQRMAKDGEWSETYACDLFDWYLKTTDETPWLAGTAQWIFKDFTTPLRVENPVPRVNQKGLLTRDMKLKEGYYVFQSYWSQEPMLRLYGHDWPVRWGKAGQKRTVRMYSNCAEVELFLNGVSMGVKKRDPKDFPCAGLRWEVAFRTGRNELRAVSRAGGKTLEDSVRFRYESRAWSKPAKLLMCVAKREKGHTTVEAELVDAAGVRCLDSRAAVRFSLAGTGRLIDNMGTPDGSRAVQLANGRAAITVQHQEKVLVGVSSPNVTSAFQEIAL